MVDDEVWGSALHPERSPAQMREDGMHQPGKAAAFSRSMRRLFPLPFFARPADKVGYSRTVRQRRNRIQRILDDCNEMIWSLNWLAGFREAQQDTETVSPMQTQVLSRVEGLAFSQKPSGDECSRPEEALKALLRGGSPYDMGVINDAVASYRSELISVPQDCSGCPQLLDVLPGDDRRYLEENSELMLRPEEDWCEKPIEPYWDPKLRYNRRAYHGLVKKLHSIGYFVYTLKPASKVGVFFVWKSNRTKLRLITDCRPTNQIFREAPGVSLMTAEGLGRIEVELADEVWCNPSAMAAMRTFVGLSDVKDCFHRLRVPAWLSRYFAWESVPAEVVGMVGKVVEGRTVCHGDYIYPCAGSLCQGFSWSLYFAQKANEQVCRGTESLCKATLGSDRGGPIVLRVGSLEGDSIHFYVYVDNLGVIDFDRSLVSTVMQELQKHFDSLGLELHASEVSSGAVDALGCVLDGGQMQSRLQSKRLWRVHQAIAGLLQRGRCSGQALEKVLGHCTFCGLMNRRSLSCFNAVYSFVHANYDCVATLWNTVREELEAFKGILFLLTQDWWKQWNPMVTSSDASLAGFGCCKAWWPKQAVAQTGRVQERSRFKRSSGHSARESALTMAGFSYDGQAWGRVDEKTAQKLTETGWELNEKFEEVPSFGLRREFWTPSQWGKWHHSEPIGILEARAVFFSLRRLALTRFGHDLRHLHLCDNLGVVLSIERSRSRNFKVLKVLREIAAYCFARNIHFSIRWVPSELNIADEPSRVHDEVDSKLLVDLLSDVCDNPLFSQAGSPPVTTHIPQRQHGAKEGAGSDQQQSGPTHTAEQTASAAKQEANVVSGRGSQCGHHTSSPQDENSGHREFLVKEVGEEASEGIQPAKESESIGYTPCAQAKDQERESRRGDRDFKHLVRVQGRVKRKAAAHLAKEAKKAAAASGHTPAGWRQEFSGGGGSHRSSERELSEENGRSGSFLRSKQDRLCGGFSGGCQPREAFREKVQRGGGQPLWGLHSGSASGQISRVWEVRSSQDPSLLEESERVEEACAISLSTCIPPPGLVWNDVENDRAWASGYGNFQPAASVHVPQTQCFADVTEDGVGPSDSGDHSSLEHRHQPDRNGRCFEDRHKRRCRPFRLRLCELLGPHFEEADTRSSDGQGMGLQLCGVPRGVSCIGSGSADQFSSIPSQTLWPVNRFCQQVTKPGRDQEAGQLGKSEECESVRKSRQTGSDVAVGTTGESERMQSSRALLGRNCTRPPLSRHLTAKWGTKGQYIGDFFSGSGRVSRAVRLAGFNTREWEILKGPDGDLTRPAVLQSVKFDIDKRRLVAAMLAPPCSSFSVARDRTRVIRNRDYPWGIPDLPEHEQNKIDVGNRCVFAALKIIKWLDAHGLPWILENPHSSKMWYLPPLIDLMNAGHTHVKVVDFCMYGTSWRKRTRLLCGNVDTVDLGRLCRRCCGKDGFCSRTNRRHVQLTGSHRSGIPMTLLAQPYPHQLCHAIAHALTAPLKIVPHSP